MNRVFVFLLLLAGLLLVAACLFLASFRDQRPMQDRKLDEALRTGDTNYILLFLNSTGDVNQPIKITRFEQNIAPLLDVAIFYGQVDAIDLLLRKGADPNRRDSTMRTPLDWVIGSTGNEVSLNTRVLICKMLLQYGANPNLQASGQKGYTPLHEASFLGDTDLVGVLLKAGANVNATNYEGLAPLNFALNADVARLLIAAGGDPEGKNLSESPAQSATRFGHLSALSVITNINK